MKGLDLVRSRFLWRIYASFAAVLLLTAIVVGYLVDRRVQESLMGGLETSLESQCLGFEPLAERVLGDGPSAELQGRLVELGREVGQRITLVEPDGTVIADSDEDPALMDDHGRRPEILQSLEQDFGSSIRFSHTVKQRLLYVARAVRLRGELAGFVRFSVPLSEVESQIAGTRATVALGSGVGFLLAMVLGLVVTRRTTRPIAELTAVAERMRAGNYDGFAQNPFKRNDEIGVLADTLDRLGAEVTHRIALISREDARLRAMISAMVEGVVAVDENDRITFCNGAAARLLDLEAEPDGRRIWEIAPIAELDSLIRDARKRDGRARVEIEMHRRGVERILLANARPFQGGGRSGVVVVLSDTTDLRRLERIRRDFVANVSHELKTPLTSIKGFVETLLTGALDERDVSERFLRRIDANVDRLTHLVSDLLSLARIESQGDRIPLEPIDWRSILTPVLARHEGSLGESSIELRTSGTDRPHLVMGDAEAMTQVLENLLDNAVKYSRGPGVVHVGLESRNDSCRLWVQDEGEGIPAEDLGRIFERFYRVDKARSSELGGTGLGLSIVKNLVVSMGGEVSVSSELGAGSTFRVDMPSAPTG